MKAKLKPCPFCGGAGIADSLTDDYGKLQHYVQCSSCMANGPWTKNPDAAVRMWNTRSEKGGAK